MWASRLTIDTLILAFLVDIVEASQHLDGRHVCPSIIDDPLGTALDQEFEQGERL
jgi:hypothetical protein